MKTYFVPPLDEDEYTEIDPLIYKKLDQMGVDVAAGWQIKCDDGDIIVVMVFFKDNDWFFYDLVHPDARECAEFLDEWIKDYPDKFDSLDEAIISEYCSEDGREIAKFLKEKT